jgi:hypothetical protein
VLPVWNGRYTGFSGKTMEYLASGNLVFCSPEPQQDLMEFFSLSENVIVLKDQEFFKETCRKMIRGGIKRKEIGDNSIFTRKHWIRHLSVFLKDLKNLYGH